MTHSYVSCDSSTLVIWLMNNYDMTRHLCVCHDPSIRVPWLFFITHRVICVRFMCVTWLIRTCDMAHSYVCHDSFICVTHATTLFYHTQGMMCGIHFMYVTSLLYMYDMTHSYVCCVAFTCVQRLYSIAHRIRCAGYDSQVWRLLHLCAMTQLHVCHVSFICVCCMPLSSIFRLLSSIFYLLSSIFYLLSSVVYHTQSNMCGIRFNPQTPNHRLTCVTWLIHTCAASHSYGCHDSILCTQSKMCGIRLNLYTFYLLSSIYYLLSSISRLLSSAAWDVRDTIQFLYPE